MARIRQGYAALEPWGRTYGKPTTFGIEGIGS
jgi:hypothetical protein